ncbi:unnamed protein product, partial [Rotaria sp. Silwood2]
MQHKPNLVCPMILGRYWIQMNHVNISFSTNRIYLHDGITSVPLLPIPPQEQLIMSLQQAVTIPPFHEKFICGYISIKSSNDVLFTSNLALQHTKLVLIPHAILHIRDYRGIISIRNKTHSPKIISRNPSLGLISQSTEQFHINAIHEQTLNYRSFSSIPSSLFSCPHCAIRFCSE